MTEYAMTFIFNKDLKKVLLIKKNKPQSMNGLLNGIGGHKELIDKTYEDCALREIKEESNLILNSSDLIRIGQLTDHEKYYVALFAAVIDDAKIKSFKSMTSEPVFYLNLNNIDERNLYIDAQTSIKKALQVIKY